MINVEKSALARLLEPHMKAGRDGDPYIGMLMTSPPESPVSSEDDELEWEGDAGDNPIGGYSKRQHTASIRAPPRQQLAAASSADRDRKRRVNFVAADDECAHTFEAAPIRSAEVMSGLTALLKQASGEGGGSSSSWQNPNAGKKKKKVYDTTSWAEHYAGEYDHLFDLEQFNPYQPDGNTPNEFR